MPRRWPPASLWSKFPTLLPKDAETRLRFPAACAAGRRTAVHGERTGLGSRGQGPVVFTTDSDTTRCTPTRGNGCDRNLWSHVSSDLEHGQGIDAARGEGAQGAAATRGTGIVGAL